MSGRIAWPIGLLGSVALVLRLSGAEPEAAPAPKPTASELSVEALVEQVLGRNPSLAEMVAAFQAASARYPQAVALEDPMLTAWFGPGSIGSRDVGFAYRLELSQKYPFPGKRSVRGQGALAEASAAGRDVDDMRLQLVEMARSAFAAYFLAERALEVNAVNLRLLGEFRENAFTRFKTGLVPEQDVFQAEVEIGRQRERQVTLERMRQVAVARINTLLHLPPDSPLAPTPKELRPAAPSPEVQELRAQALSRRPDLQALADRLAADQAALVLAQKEFYPDFELMAAYDRFWQGMDRDLAPQVALRLNLPVWNSKRWAAVAEAQAKVAQRRAELDRQVDQVNFQVQEAHEQLRESEKIVRLYDETILRAAEQNVKAAQSAYVTGKIPFLSLIEAQRNHAMLRDRYYETIADYFRRWAALERAVGGPIQ
jgi:cobalt-zinc-cadmium efflux system outer membrane protein